jgi:hypothetical protein
MAYPAVRSVSYNASDVDAASIVVTKPAGLAEGDLMIAFVGLWNPGGNRYHITPSGWTAVQVAVIDSYNRSLACYKKVASAGDAAASNFTFAFDDGNVDKSTGAIYAITGAASGNEVTVSEADTSEIAANPVTFTTALTPVVAESLVVCGWYVSHLSIASIMTASLPTLTPTTTLTENVDTGVRDGASDGVSLFCYSGNYAGVTPITSRSVTVSVTPDTDGQASIILLVNAPQSVTGTNAVFQTSPVTFATLTGSTQNATSDFIEISPDFLTQSGNGTTRTEWGNESKPSTNWQNDI